MLVCWDLSLVGGPFSEHTISWMTANGTTDSLSLDEAELETEQCALGATVSGSCVCTCLSYCIITFSTRPCRYLTLNTVRMLMLCQ